MNQSKPPVQNSLLMAKGTSDYKKPNASVDMSIFTIVHDSLHVLLTKRAEPPFKDCWSLVGGYIDIDQDCHLESTAMRKLIEKTGVSTPYLEQYGSVGNAFRDPRGWSVTVVYFALVAWQQLNIPVHQRVTEVKWAKVVNGAVTDLLAFDHAELLKQCATRLRNKILYTSIPVHLLNAQFTLRELQTMYEIILGKKLDTKSFRRRILTVNLLDETNEFRNDRGRPAQLYRLKVNKSTHFFNRPLAGTLS